MSRDNAIIVAIMICGLFIWAVNLTQAWIDEREDREREKLKDWLGHTRSGGLTTQDMKNHARDA